MRRESLCFPQNAIERVFEWVERLNSEEKLGLSEQNTPKRLGKVFVPWDKPIRSHHALSLRSVYKTHTVRTQMIEISIQTVFIRMTFPQLKTRNLIEMSSEIVNLEYMKSVIKENRKGASRQMQCQLEN